MLKYISLAICTLFWIIFPIIAQLGGMGVFTEYIDVDEFGESIEKPTIVTFGNKLIDGIGFYFKILTFSLPNAPILVSFIVWGMLVVTILSIILLISEFVSIG